MKLIKEISIILTACIIIAFLYNYQRDKSLPLIYEPKQFEEVSDDLLFKGLNTENNTIADSTDWDDVSINENEKTTQHLGDAEESITNNKAVNNIKDDKAAAEKKAQEQSPNIADNKKIKKEETNEANLPQNSSGDVHERTVTYKQMLKILENQDKFQLIDARNPEQFEKAKIGKAINIFPYNDSMDEIADKIFNLPPDKTYIIYCDGGECDSSHKLADMMINFGFSNLFIYTGGWEEWIAKRGESRP